MGLTGKRAPPSTGQHFVHLPIPPPSFNSLAMLCLTFCNPWWMGVGVQYTVLRPPSSSPLQIALVLAAELPHRSSIHWQIILNFGPSFALYWGRRRRRSGWVDIGRRCGRWYIGGGRRRRPCYAIQPVLCCVVDVRAIWFREE